MGKKPKFCAYMIVIRIILVSLTIKNDSTKILFNNMIGLNPNLINLIRDY
jgi:hypothetical protein